MTQQLDPKMFDYVRIIAFFREHCPWCLEFKRSTLPMITAMGVKITAIAGAQAESFYGVEAFPALVYVNDRGEKLYLEEGHVPPARVIKVITDLYQGKTPDEYNPAPESVEEETPKPEQPKPRKPQSKRRPSKEVVASDGEKAPAEDRETDSK